MAKIPIGQLDRHRGRLRDADQVAERAAADGQRQHAEGGGARQQVHDHGLERHQDRAEDHHQQHERHQQHAAEEQRQPVGDAAGGVEVGGGHPADVDGQTGAGDGGRDGVVAQRVDQVLGRLVLRRGGGRPRSTRGVARGVDDERGDEGHAVDLGELGRRPRPPRRAARVPDAPWTVSTIGAEKPGPNPSASRS